VFEGTTAGVLLKDAIDLGILPADRLYKLDMDLSICDDEFDGSMALPPTPLMARNCGPLVTTEVECCGDIGRSVEEVRCRLTLLRASYSSNEELRVLSDVVLSMVDGDC
jgi:hypothetical protein